MRNSLISRLWRPLEIPYSYLQELRPLIDKTSDIPKQGGGLLDGHPSLLVAVCSRLRSANRWWCLPTCLASVLTYDSEECHEMCLQFVVQTVQCARTYTPPTCAAMVSSSLASEKSERLARRFTCVAIQLPCARQSSSHLLCSTLRKYRVGVNAVDSSSCPRVSVPPSWVQAQVLEKVVDLPVLKTREVPVAQKVVKTIPVPQVQFVNKALLAGWGNILTVHFLHLAG